MASTVGEVVEVLTTLGVLTALLTLFGSSDSPSLSWHVEGMVPSTITAAYSINTSVEGESLGGNGDSGKEGGLGEHVGSLFGI